MRPTCYLSLESLIFGITDTHNLTGIIFIKKMFQEENLNNLLSITALTQKCLASSWLFHQTSGGRIWNFGFIFLGPFYESWKLTPARSLCTLLLISGFWRAKPLPKTGMLSNDILESIVRYQSIYSSKTFVTYLANTWKEPFHFSWSQHGSLVWLQFQHWQVPT